MRTNQLLFSGYPGSFLGVKRPGREANDSLPIAEVMNEWSYASFPPIRPHSVYREYFTFVGYIVDRS
jgi:hypothetical protein